MTPYQQQPNASDTTCNAESPVLGLLRRLKGQRRTQTKGAFGKARAKRGPVASAPTTSS